MILPKQDRKACDNRKLSAIFINKKLDGVSRYII